jgi:hypothetical protein
MDVENKRRVHRNRRAQTRSEKSCPISHTAHRFCRFTCRINRNPASIACNRMPVRQPRHFHLYAIKRRLNTAGVSTRGRFFSANVPSLEPFRRLLESISSSYKESMSCFVHPRVLACRTDEGARKKIREQWVVLPECEHASQQLGPSQQWTICRSCSPQDDMIPSAGRRMPPHRTGISLPLGRSSWLPQTPRYSAVPVRPRCLREEGSPQSRLGPA